jgi:hypothetical protein
MQLVISEGCVMLLVAQLGSSVSELVDEAALALAAIAAHDPSARDFVLAADALNALLQLIQAATPLATVRRVVFAVAMLVGVTHPLSRLPAWSAVQPALERQAMALFCNDPEVIIHAARSLAILLPGCTEISFDRRLCQLLESDHVGVVRAVLAAVHSVAQYDDHQLQVMRWRVMCVRAGVKRGAQGAVAMRPMHQSASLSA